MGCFLGCFGPKKDRKRQTQRYEVINREGRQRQVSQNVFQATAFPEEQVNLEKPQSLVAEPSVKHEEQLGLNNKKKVTFDSNIKTYEHIPVNGSTESLLEKEKGDFFSPAARSQSQMLSRSNSEVDSVNSSVGSYPTNHRYQNCQESDDEVEDSEYDEDNDFNDDYEDEDEDEEEGDCGDDYDASMETVGRYARDRSGNVHPVLNPVENLSQWKAAKAKKTTPPSNPQKENVSFNFQTPPKPQKNQDIAVDASLSNWLTSTEESISSDKSLSQESTVTSLRNLEDRPILGVLSVEELRQFSATSSPRKSPRRSPEDMPIIGSVGSYWSHSSSAEDSGSVSSYKGRPHSTSKYREEYAK